MKIKRIRRRMRLALKLFKVRANMSKQERYEFYRDVWCPCQRKITDKTEANQGIENLDRWKALNDLWIDRTYADIMCRKWLAAFDKCKNISRKVKSLFA